MSTLLASLEATRFRRPIGSWLLMVPMLLALRLAPLPLGMSIYLLVLCVAARSLGCVINDYADQDFDCHVQRTKNRPFAQTPRSLLEITPVLLSLSALCGSCFFVLPTETLPFCLAAPLWIILYAWAKRWCPAPQLILAIAFSWSIPIISSIAFGNQISWPLYQLFFANIVWVCGFDTTYALSDYEDDCKLPIYSLTKTLGPIGSQRFSSLSVILANTLIAIIFPLSPVSPLSFAYAGFLSLDTLYNTRAPLSLFYRHGFLGFIWVLQAWTPILYQLIK